MTLLCRSPKAIRPHRAPTGQVGLALHVGMSKCLEVIVATVWQHPNATQESVVRFACLVQRPWIRSQTVLHRHRATS